MRGINRVIFSGNVTGKIDFASTDRGQDVCTFIIASDRAASGGTVTAYAKVNVYMDGLVAACRVKLEKGCYVLVEGELMNRNSPAGRMTEIRAWELLFLNPAAAVSPSKGAPTDVVDPADRDP
jgi:single-stranded DNA-binding protein